MEECDYQEILDEASDYLDIAISRLPKAALADQLAYAINLSLIKIRIELYLGMKEIDLALRSIANK